MDTTIPVSLAIGFSLRIFLLSFDRRSNLRPAFVGIWEGIALSRGLSEATSSQLDAFFPCFLRLMFDFLFTENVNTMITILFSLVLALLISEALSSHHDHDIQTRRRPGPEWKRVDGARTTKVYEVPDSLHVNRARFVIPHAPHHVEVANTQSAVVSAQDRQIFGRVDHPPLVPTIVDVQTHSSSPEQLARTGSPVPNPITPPSFPPQHRSFDTQSSDSEATNTSLVLAPAQTLSLQLSDVSDLPLTVEVSAIRDEGCPAEDEPRTPLELGLQNLPLTIASPARQHSPNNEIISILFEDISLHDDAASVHTAGMNTSGMEGDNVSEASLQTRTELSTISPGNAPKITARADLLRIQAWEEEAEKRRLKEEMEKAVSRRKIKDAFMFRRKMEAAEERARQLHGRAARRHFHARNLSRKIGEIDVHFLFVSEAIKQVEKSLQEAIERGSDRIRVIVGRGLHSHDGRSKLRPAIIAEMQRQGIHCQILAGNPGVLVLTVP